MQKTKKIFAALTLIILMGVSGLALITKLQGGSLLSVQSKSMVPVIKKGDLVRVKRVPADQLRVGDVITFINPLNKKETVTHRIYAFKQQMNGRNIITKGDANLSIDQQISPSAVVGKFTQRIPYAGYGIDYIRKPLGLIFIIYLPALLIIAGELRRLASYYKSRETYFAPGAQSRYQKMPNNRSMIIAKMLPILLIIPLGVSIKVYAELQSSVSLTSSSISTVPSGTNSGGGSSNVSCQSNNNVNISTNTNQTATTGSANVSGNTSGGNATSGNASNSSSSNISVAITGC